MRWESVLIVYTLVEESIVLKTVRRRVVLPEQS